MNKSFTPAQLVAARERVTQDGRSIIDWARQQSLDYHVVHQTLSGRTKGLRGESYRVAIALGLRRQPAKKHSAAKTSQQVAA